MTGVDPMVDLRGKYSSAVGSVRALKQFAGGGLDEAAARIGQSLQTAEVSVGLAKRGDCVLADVDGGIGMRSPALGLVSLSGRSALFAGPVGLTEIPLRACRRAWTV